MKKSEIEKINESIEEIKRLITMESASFHIDKAQDDYIKTRIRPWLMWIEFEALKIEEIINKNQK